MGCLIFIYWKQRVAFIIAILILFLSQSYSWGQDIERDKKKKKLPPRNLQGAMLANAQFNFSTSTLNLNGATLLNPTSLQFGPDKRLYVAQQNGLIRAFTIKRNAANDYVVNSSETINLINQIPNHNDDGSLISTVTTRQITGIFVAGTATNPILYVSSSDSRIGGGSTAGDKNLDTNSGIISRLTWNGSTWTKVDLVRGLPRSEENHANNGIQIDALKNMLYVAVGGFTNAGGPSNNFAFITEYALAAAILSVDLNAIDAMPTMGSGNTAYKYDLPTLDDPTRANNANGTDVNDPFGGNDGLNQAKIVTGGPVQIYSPGYRNAYDLVITKSRKMYTIDNGANQGWGGYPDKEGSSGAVTNNYVSGEPGSTGPGVNDPKVNNLDNLHYIGNIDTYVPGSHYGGHPTPVRANPAGAGLYTYGTSGVWRTSKTDPVNPLPADWPPVPVEKANKIEGDYQQPGVSDAALLTFSASTNGITEYTASNFNNGLKGVLLAAGYEGNIEKIYLTPDGTDVLNSRESTNKLNQDLPFASGFGSQPLDLVAQGDNDIFPGTVWAATYGPDVITIFEPQDLVACTGTYSTSLDDDLDGFSNADEIDNGTNPCSASSKPTDSDNDLISDINDSDDDNDGLDDKSDYFALDANNGLSTSMPIRYDLFNNEPGTGLFGLGFTGLMCNKLTNYSSLYDESNLIAGGAVGAFTVVGTSPGDALGTSNNQENGFQFGLKVGTNPFIVQARMFGPFFNNATLKDFQSQGIYIGTGDQDNYLKLVINANGGQGGLQVVYENAGVATSQQFALTNGIPSSSLDLILAVNPSSGLVQPKYISDGGQLVSLGSPIQVSGTLLTILKGGPALAIGVISTSRNATPFTATWDFINVTEEQTSEGAWQTIVPASGTPTARHENAFVQAGDKFYLFGGRGIKPVQIYNYNNKTWTNGASTPIALHHFQAATLDGLIYVVNAFTGSYPHETPVSKIYIYNTLTNKWFDGPAIPENRRRGAAGTVVYNNKIYTVGGIIDGHWSGTVNWFDEFDPATNTWKVLPDAPRIRDHYQAAIIGNKLYLAGGRQTSASTNNLFNLTIQEVDVFDFTTGKWSTLPQGSNLLTKRAGTATAVLGDELIIIGGESGTQTMAHNETEALNVLTNTWRSLADLQQGRHGTQAIVSNGGIYIAAGSGERGGTPELSSQEAFYMTGSTTPSGTTLTQSKLIAPASLNFGVVPVNTSINKTVELTNTTGNQAIIISSVSLTGETGAFSYVAPQPLPIILPSGKSVTITLKFSPATTGVQSAALVINHSGLVESTTIALSGGEGGSPTGSEIRVNSGGSQVTAYNNTFVADQYFSGGQKVANTQLSIANTTDDILYQSERTATANLGSFAYNIPVAAGRYRVRLHFAEIYYGAPGGGSGATGKRVFSVTAEGSPFPGLTNYDIFADVGTMAAVIKEAEVEVQDGTLNLNFTASVNRPKVSAIEVIPATGTTTNQPPVANAGTDKTITLPTNSITLNGTGNDADGNIASYSWTKQSGPAATLTGATTASLTASSLVAGTYVFRLTVTDNGGATAFDEVNVTVVSGSPTGSEVRVNSGGSQATAYNNTFAADQYFSGGQKVANTQLSIANTTDDILYQSERTATANLGSFAYNIPVAAGRYRVRLHFAEIYYGAPGGGSGATGKRVFSVTAEGSPFPGLTNYDIFADVGTMAAVIKEAEVEVQDGTLNLNFTASVNRPKVSAIEVIPATGTTTNQLAQTNDNNDLSNKSGDFSVGLNIQSLNNFSVYPNSFDNQLNLKITTDKLQEYKIVIYDVLGRILYQSIFSPQSLQESLFKMDLSHSSFQPGGIYFVQVLSLSENKRNIIKVMKAK